ncbi:MAG: GDYXXLXY domain-containing protein [Elusimicrobia bacterium]|nr:GDYXXLXY domain-containing protein [Elusimicrobiota bacterium]
MTPGKTRWFWAIVALQVAAIGGMVARKQSVLWYGRPITLRTNPIDPHSLFSGDYARLAFAAHQLRDDEWTPWPPKISETVYAEFKPGTTTWEVVGPRHDIPAGMPADHVVMRGTIRSSFQREGHPVLDLQDLSDPGWLETQPSTASWRRSWGFGGVTSREIWFNGHLQEGKRVHVFLGSYDGGRDWQLYEVCESSWSRMQRSYNYNRSVQRILTGQLGPYRRERTLNVDYGIESYYIPEGKGPDYQRVRLDAEIVVDAAGHAVVRRVQPAKD